jgi:hypothetical protein
MSDRRLHFLAAALTASCATVPANAQLIHTFTGQQDGRAPSSGLIRDASGALYGVTSKGGTGSDGTAYVLIPPNQPNGAWAERIIHSFPASSDDGYFPTGDLVFGSGRSLFGLTAGRTFNHQYVNSIIYELTPSSSGSGPWTETILHTFSAEEGKNPQGGLIADSRGALYGVTAGGGAFNEGIAFKLSPPAAGSSAWTMQTLHAFGSSATDGAAPIGKLVMDADGNLYGATTGTGHTTEGSLCFGSTTACGTIFELSPPKTGGTEWTETVLYHFTQYALGSSPYSGLTLGAGGTLYGVTEAGGNGTMCTFRCGIVYALAPPQSSGTPWQYSVIFNFDGYNGDSPQAAVTVDRSGNLYGTTYFGGIVTTGTDYGFGGVFKLTPPAGGIGGPWTEIYYPLRNASNGDGLEADILIGPDHQLYSTASQGGIGDDGTAFKLQQ